MKKGIIGLVLGIFVFTSVPVFAGGVFDNSSDWGHFAAGFILQEILNDRSNKEKNRMPDLPREQDREDVYRSKGHKKNKRNRRPDYRNEEHGYNCGSKNCGHQSSTHVSGSSKMRMLFRVHDRIVNEVLEESYESTGFILDIHERNNYRLHNTSRDIKSFVYEYFEIFHEEQCDMYDLWVDTKFSDWLESYQSKKRG